MNPIDIYNNFDKYKKIAIFGTIAIIVIFVIAADAKYYSNSNTQ